MEREEDSFVNGTQFLQIFTYANNWDIVLNLVFIAIALIYILLTGPLVKVIPGATPVKGLHRLSFLVGLMFYYLAEGSPIQLLSHELFSIHMTQMTIMYIVMPPLLLLGVPGWFVRPLLKLRVIRTLLNF